MSEGPPRYCPTRPLPPYAFVPGRNPHPTRDPEGHSYGRPHTTPAWRAEQDWREVEDYLFGCDLYNHAFLWEAHEAWEGIWQECKHDPILASFLQGLIQCSAAALKIAMGQPRGLSRLAELGTGRLEEVARQRGGLYWGLDLGSFVADFRAFAARPEARLEERPGLRLELD